MSETVKTFKDLVLRSRNDEMEGNLAQLFFPNGYGVSVITWPHFYTSKEAPYEMAILIGTEQDWTICYDTPITSDVLGYLTEDQVTGYMLEVQKLPSTAI